ncbi:MAG: carboxylating nicotinate-nucleotide diphosphorylase [Gammaproteobacteria bacterium]|nr:MAG: carboxylating nicotinate-nucleotide diphosphorylase [Gammaproteobacteria bacterium]
MGKQQADADIGRLVDAALAEDVGDGDLTAALLPPTARLDAAVIARQAAVLCGQPWFDAVFARLDPAIKIEWLKRDGDRIEAGDKLVRLHGPAAAMLTGERTALNFLQTLSATATAARRYVEAVAGTGVTILDTRKTIPGLRSAQKYAVRCGGASNHRIGLFDAILIKENHIAAAGGIRPAADAAARAGVLVEIEVENLAQLEEALGTTVSRVLLDNFELDGLRAAVALRDRLAPEIGLEASGGITLASVRAVAETGVDFISVGEITKDIDAVDLSMRFEAAAGG